MYRLSDVHSTTPRWMMEWNTLQRFSSEQSESFAIFFKNLLQNVYCSLKT